MQNVHQTGGRDYSNVRAAYARHEIQVEVAPFLSNMAERFAWADMIVCRAGAITAAEVAAAGRAAIFIPFGKATDSHQLRNAQEMVNAGAGRLIAEPELTAERLTKEIFSLLDQSGEMGKLAANARNLAHPYAVREIVDLIQEAERPSRKESEAHDGIVLQFSENSFGGNRRHRHERNRRGPAYPWLFRLWLGHKALHNHGAPAGSGRHDLRRPHKRKTWKTPTSLDSSAGKPTIPEVLEAHKRKIPGDSPARETLAELMRLKYGIAVAAHTENHHHLHGCSSILATAHLYLSFAAPRQSGRHHRGAGKGEYLSWKPTRVIAASLCLRR